MFLLKKKKAILKNPEDKTKVSLIFANVNVDDILLKKELDELASTNKDRFKVYYVLNNVRKYNNISLLLQQLSPHQPHPASKRLARRSRIRDQGNDDYAFTQIPRCRLD